MPLSVVFPAHSGLKQGFQMSVQLLIRTAEKVNKLILFVSTLGLKGLPESLPEIV